MSSELEYKNHQMLKVLHMMYEVFGETYLYDQEMLLSTFIEKMEETNG